MKKISIKALAAGAICTCLSVIFMMICIYVPFFAIISAVISGMPLMFLGVKYGTRVSGLAFVASLLVLFVINGDILSVLMLGIMNLLPGVIIGFSVSRRFSFSNSVFAVSGAVLVGYFIQLWMIDSLNGGNGIEIMIGQAFDNAKAVMMQLLNTLSADSPVPVNELTANVDLMINQAKEMVMIYMPTFFIAASVVTGYCIYMFAIFLMGRLRLRRVMYIPFNRLKASRPMCYVAMLLYIITGFSEDVSPITACFMNMASILYAFIGVCGLSLIDFKLSKKISSGYVRAVIYVAVFFVGYMMIGILMHILVLLGLLDAMLNFRLLTKVGEDDVQR